MKQRNALYNGKSFPRYIFTGDEIKHIFFEFSYAFEEDFWEPFKAVLEKNNIEEIVIENLKPHYFFRETINVSDLPRAFIEATRELKLEGFFPSRVSLYMLTEIALVYPENGENSFCLYLDRRFDLAILGVKDLIEIPSLAFIRKDEVFDYLYTLFNGKLPENSQEQLKKNWRIVPNSGI